MPIAVEIAEPKHARSPVVFASPHSGRVYPEAFLAAVDVDPLVLRSSEDAYVDLLLRSAPEFGAPLITSQVPRAFVDFNRASDELDPALITGAPRAGLNPRISSGLGVLARVVANGRTIYRGKISMDEARARIDQYWSPYHNALAGLLERQHRRFGAVVLVDTHSMPHEALNGHVWRSGARPDVIVGDRWGASCSPEILVQVEEALRAVGLTVARNTPFAGAYIARRYGQPSMGMHAVQLEIDRALYLDEKRVQPAADFDAFEAVLRQALQQIAAIDLGGSAADLVAE